MDHLMIPVPQALLRYSHSLEYSFPLRLGHVRTPVHRPSVEEYDVVDGVALLGLGDEPITTTTGGFDLIVLRCNLQ